MALTPDAKKLWKKIRNPSCTDCGLHEEAQTVCLIGDGPVPADIMIVGEAPGFREDDIGKPFSGKAGKLLDDTLETVGLRRDDIFISNANKCRPPENRTPTRAEVKACHPFLDLEIKYVKPKFILSVGNTALLSLTKRSGIMKHRGETYELDGAQVFATIHPAAVLRNPRYEMLWKSDIQAFARLVKGEESEIPPPRVFLVTKKDTLAACVRAILASEAVAYDFETSTLEDYDPDGRVACIGVSPKPGVSFVVPIHHPESPWKQPERVLQTIGKALMYAKRRIAHNAKFDDRWFHRYGISINADFDTMIAAHLLDENRLKGLKVLAPMLLGVDRWDLDTSDGKAMVYPIKKVALYNGKDTDNTLRLYYLFKKELLKPENRRTLRLFKTLMMPASKVLTQVERNGMWIDRERLMTRSIETQKKIEKIYKKLTKHAGEEINWNSPQQVARIFFGKLKLPLYDLTAGGAPSTKESVLLRLRKKHPAAELLIQWRQQNKYMSTYLKRWAEVADGQDRIHPNYKITGTVTGRLSSGKEEGSGGRGLNVQQVPRDPFIRGIIGAPAGWRFVEADFSQVELRIAAHYSGDPTLSRYFQLNRDVHLETAVKVTGKPANTITKEERKLAKAVNFGFVFGMGYRKFVEYARDNYDVEVTEDEAEEFRDTFFREFSSLQAWHQRQRRLANRYRQVQSLIGRTRHLPDINSQDKEVRMEAERQAINSPVQSLASDMMLLSMIILYGEIDPEEVKIVGSVHDSILFEIREDVVDKWVPRIKQVMENLPLKKMFGVDLDIPIVADISISHYWGESA